MKTLVVLPVHGMGETRRMYADSLRSGLKERLGEDLWSLLAFRPVFYQDIIQENQERVWEAMTEGARLHWKSLRQFMLYAFSDAASLEHQSSEADSAYVLAQERIRYHLLGLLEDGIDPSTRVVLLPHSLGCQVLSNYIWDAQRDEGIWRHKPIQRPKAEIDFLKLRTLRLIASAGCNIPLLVAGLKTIRPFAKPHPSFRWLNFYDKDDVLGWPLKPLSPAFDAIVEKDVQVNSGSPAAAWTPFSHNEYWTDRSFLRPVASAIRSLME